MRRPADRFARLFRDARVSVLPISRTDMANWLGLAIETVSRLFSRMKTGGVYEFVGIRHRDLLAQLCASEAKN